MKYPLYSGENVGVAYDKNVEYEMIIITQWSDRSEEAKEVTHKTYYFRKDFNSIVYLQKYINNEFWCENLFNDYCNNSKLKFDVAITKED